MRWANRQGRKYRTLRSVETGIRYTRDTTVHGDTILAIGKEERLVWAFNVEPTAVREVFSKLRDQVKEANQWTRVL